MVHGLRYPAYDDEATHILGGKVLAAGGRLYAAFIDSHGPLMFAAAQIYGALFGWQWPNGVRLLPGLTTVAAIAAVAGSTMLPTIAARLQAVCVLCALLAAGWLHQALFMFNFYPVAGTLAAIVLAGFVLPAIRSRPLAPLPAFAAGIAETGLVAAAYSFAPSVVLFAGAGIAMAVASGQRRAALWFTAGAAAGASLLLAWLAARADLRGYLAFHFAESQFDYGAVVLTLPHFLASFAPPIAPPMLIHALAVAWFALATLVLWLGAASNPLTVRRERVAILVTMTAIAALNARGDLMSKDATFLIAAASACALALAQGASGRLPLRLGSIAVAGASLLIAPRADYAPYMATAAEMRMAPATPLGRRDDSAPARRIRSLIGPGERMLVLTYNPELYLQADRLPMDRYYAWFTWDEMYARHPAWFGRPRNLCRALHDQPPPLLIVGPWPPGWVGPQSYIACLPDIEARSYVRLPPIPGFAGVLYLRRDRAPAPPLPPS